MSRKLLTRRFLAEHPAKELSAPALAHFTILHKGIEEVVSEFVDLQCDAQREASIQRERKMLEAENDPQVLCELMRKNLDVISRPLLIAKALEHEEAIMPQVVERLIRNNHNIFIENAVRLLGMSKEDHTGSLRQRYGEIRSPYVQSMVCLVTGIRAGEEVIPWVYEQYFQLQKLHPQEDYDQGPLLALHELFHRFYQK